MRYDCAIVGAGTVGLSLAIALAQCGYRVVVLEKEDTPPLPTPPIEQRTLALSYASVRILDMLGVWEPLVKPAVPIEQVVVSVQGQYGTCRIRHQECGVEALGYVVGLSTLEDALLQKCQTLEHVTILKPTFLQEYHRSAEDWQLTLITEEKKQALAARILIAADGTHSVLRQSQGIASRQFMYDHFALMMNVRFEAKESCTAIERFLPQGAIALLPWQADLATCVLTLQQDQAQSWMSLSDGELIARCQKQLGFAYGKIVALGKKAAIPLTMSLAEKQMSPRFLLMGNAAHTLHPIAAQGLNLSLRDIWQIRSQLLKYRAHPCDLGAEHFLQEYVEAREPDQKRIIFATDKIARFMAGGPLPTWVRAKGMLLFDCLAPLKNQFSRYSLGLL